MRVDTLDLEEMREHVESRGHLQDDRLAGPERHRKLTAAVDWSYRLLSPSEQSLMRRLSVFGAEFTLESAFAVGGSAGATRSRVIEDVAALAAKSLLTAELRDGKMNYRQTHVTRAFAFEMLLQSGELESAQRCHTEHLRELAEQAEHARGAPRLGHDRQ